MRCDLGHDVGEVESSRSLNLARAWYAVLGLGALILTAGHVSGAFQGSRFDAPLVAGGLALGLLAIGASVWVGVAGPRAVVVWAGIAAGVLAFLILFGIAAQTPSADVLLLAGIPTALALAAGARMAFAQARARTA